MQRLFKEVLYRYRTLRLLLGIHALGWWRYQNQHESFRNLTNSRLPEVKVFPLASTLKMKVMSPIKGESLWRLRKVGFLQSDFKIGVQLLREGKQISSTTTHRG